MKPFGFHLSDGTLYTYLTGDEYEDIAASWDWNLIPGITTDYGATNLSCLLAGSMGVHLFVGGVSDGAVGAAAMRYTNPITGGITFQKAWFFLDDDIQVVMLSDVALNSSSPVISVLDQKKHIGSYYVDDSEIRPPYLEDEGAVNRSRPDGPGNNQNVPQTAFAAPPTENITYHQDIQTLWHAKRSGTRLISVLWSTSPSRPGTRLEIGPPLGSLPNRYPTLTCLLLGSSNPRSRSALRTRFSQQ